MADCVEDVNVTSSTAGTEVDLPVRKRTKHKNSRDRPARERRQRRGHDREIDNVEGTSFTEDFSCGDLAVEEATSGDQTMRRNKRKTEEKKAKEKSKAKKNKLNGNKAKRNKAKGNKENDEKKAKKKERREADRKSSGSKPVSAATKMMSSPTGKESESERDGDNDKANNHFKCEVFRQAERNSIGTVEDIGDSEFEMDVSSCDEDDTDESVDDADEDNPFDRRMPVFRRSSCLMPDVSSNDLEPISDKEMEHLLKVKIVIDWEVACLHKFGFSRNYAKAEIYAEANDIKIRHGMLSLRERRALIDRLEAFRTQYGVRNPLYHMGMFESQIARFEKRKFWWFIAKGMNDRTMHSIYQSVQKMFHPFNYIPLKKTKQEKRFICNFIKKFGRRWTQLGKIMGVRASLLYEEYLKYKYRNRKGKWTSAEYRRLIAAMVTLTGERDLEKLHHNLPWTKVSEIVKTKSPKKCLYAWTLVISRHIFASAIRKWRQEDNVLLIELMYDGQYKSELDVPWSELYPLFGMTNCMQLKPKWGQLRVQVPGYYLKGHEEQVEYLYTHVLPCIKKKILARKEKAEQAMKAAVKEHTMSTEANIGIVTSNSS